MVNTYVQIIGVPLATIWCSGMNWNTDGDTPKAITSVTLPHFNHRPDASSIVDGSLHTQSDDTKGEERGEMLDMSQSPMMDRVRIHLGTEPLVVSMELVSEDSTSHWLFL